MTSKSDTRWYNGISATSPNSHSAAFIPECLALKSADIIVGKGRRSQNHPGNKMLGRIVASTLADYAAASTKNQKTDILSNIIAVVRKNGGFVKQDSQTGQWIDVGDFAAREKIARLFREALHDKYRSSNESKKKRQLRTSSKQTEEEISDGLKNKGSSVSYEFGLPQKELSASMYEYDIPQCTDISKSFNIDFILEPVPISEMCRIGRGMPFQDFIDYQFMISNFPL